MGEEKPNRRKICPIPQLLATGLVIALTGGCTAVTDSRMEDAYQPPALGAPAAFLKGSGFSESGLFGSEHRGFVTMIDLKPIPDAAGSWNRSIAVSPGRHDITAECRYSNFIAHAYLSLTARAGLTYQLMIKTSDEYSSDGRRYNDFWIVDLGSGNAVTPLYHAQVTGGKKGTVFNIPN